MCIVNEKTNQNISIVQRALTANPKHVDGGLVELDEDSVVDLAQAEQLQDLLDLRRNLVDTSNAHHEGQLGLGRHIVAEE